MILVYNIDNERVIKMTVIKPTKQQVFESLREKGCCWVGGHGCACYSRQICDCFVEEEKRLTKTELSDSEIEQSQFLHEQTWKEIWDLI